MITSVTPDLFTAEHDFRLPGGMVMPLRMTGIRLPSGDVVLHSPIPLTEALVSAVAAVGPVKHLIAPNRLHHLSAGAWQKRYPEAHLHAAPGLGKKRPDLRIDHELGGHELGTPGTPPAWAEVLDQRLIDGAPVLAESVFFHRPSRSLLVTDLLVNIVRPANFMTKLVLTMTGTRGRFAMSRANRLFVKDRAAFRASLEAMLAWDFAQIIPAHGDLLTSPDVRALTRQAVSWGLR
ncbi:MAG TPA: DUF4336 domain-containing protein [Polyangia bacterium]